ncbi:phosphoesterase [Nitrospira sp.]|nr:phosphoesterase [Nitrospira sp.]
MKITTPKAEASAPVRIGVIADTHGRFDPELFQCFAGVTHILHAGDIGDREVIRQLERIAPVTAISGNVDGFSRSGFPAERVIELAGRLIALRHVVYEGQEVNVTAARYLDRVRPDICVFGHTHRPFSTWRGTAFLFNPGSAGPKRFRLPRTVGLLRLFPAHLESEHVFLGEC